MNYIERSKCHKLLKNQNSFTLPNRSKVVSDLMRDLVFDSESHLRFRLVGRNDIVYAIFCCIPIFFVTFTCDERRLIPLFDLFKERYHLEVMRLGKHIHKRYVF